MPQQSTLENAIGLVPLGAPSPDLPPHATESCEEEGGPPGCEGGRFDAVYYVSDASGVVSKGIRFHSIYANDEVLPFGLTKFDKFDEALKKIKPLWKSRLFIEDNEMDEETTARTGFCYINGRGKPFAMGLSFLTSGQISGITTFTPEFHETPNP